MGKASRDKGKRGELEVAALLRAVYPDARRRVSAEESQRTGLGYDIDGTPGLVVQVQMAARPTIEAKVAEAVEALTERHEDYDVTTSDIAVAFTRRCSRRGSGEWIVSMRAEDFLRLAKAWKERTT